tara:strand:+ start:83 stop:1180 length:1098 start_codon:yes stop_codon:yes gene_type:complete
LSKYSFLEKNNLKIEYDISVIIPTLNRPKVLLAQIGSLVRCFNQIKPDICIQILISENNPDIDKTVDKEKLDLVIKKNLNPKNISFVFIKRTSRLSLGEHMNFLSRSVNCHWIMWIGDDDLLSSAYLKYLTDTIKSDDKNIQCVFPVRFGPNGDKRNQGISEYKFFKYADNEEIIDKKIIVKRYSYNINDLPYIINRGTQLSGILYRKEIIDKGNIALPKDNLFPWICYQVEAIKNGTILSVDGYHVKITSDTPKLFSYRKDGLLPEISEAIISGFANDRKAGTYFASEIIKTFAYWRIFKTAKTGIGSLKNYIFSITHRKTDVKVFFLVLPKIIKMSFYHDLVHSFPKLYGLLKTIKKIISDEK